MIHKIKCSVSINRLFWEDAQELAKKDNVSMSEYVSQAVAWYNGKHREAVKAQEREDQKKEAVQLKRQSLEIEQKRLELGDLNDQYRNTPQNRQRRELERKDDPKEEDPDYLSALDWAVGALKDGGKLELIERHLTEDYNMSKFQANQLIAFALTRTKNE